MAFTTGITKWFRSRNVVLTSHTLTHQVTASRVEVSAAVNCVWLEQGCNSKEGGFNVILAMNILFRPIYLSFFEKHTLGKSSVIFKSKHSFEHNLEIICRSFFFSYFFF